MPRAIRVPRYVTRGKAAVACPYCATDASSSLDFRAGTWRCASCGRFGQITRDRRAATAKDHVNLELSPDSLAPAA
jgi:ribosomal protein L37AE/L43A